MKHQQWTKPLHMMYWVFFPHVHHVKKGSGKCCPLPAEFRPVPAKFCPLILWVLWFKKTHPTSHDAGRFLFCDIEYMHSSWSTILESLSCMIFSGRCMVIPHIICHMMQASFFMISEVYDVLTKRVVKCHLNFIMSWTTPWFYSMFCFNASILVVHDLHQSKSRPEGLNPLKSQKMTLG